MNLTTSAITDENAAPSIRVRQGLKAKSAQKSGLKPRRGRVLGDITNRAASNSNTSSSAKLRNSSLKQQKSFTPRAINVPRDEVGNVQQPDYIPTPHSSAFFSYTPRLFDDDQLVVSAAQSLEDDHLDMFGEPLVKPYTYEANPKPSSSFIMEHPSPPSYLTSSIQTPYFNHDEFISGDDFSLELA